MSTEIITSTDRAISNQPIWYPLPNEPHMWNERFTHYYLTQPSVNRSMLQAYRQYRIDNATTEEEREQARKSMSTSAGWDNIAHKWNWLSRAAAYDRHITNKVLDRQSETLTIHKGRKLDMWASVIEQASMELVRRDKDEWSPNLLLSTIKTLDRQMVANLPQQPQMVAHIHALHPDLQRLIRDAIESGE